LTIGLPYIRLWERLRESERLRGRNVFWGWMLPATETNRD